MDPHIIKAGDCIINARFVTHARWFTTRPYRASQHGEKTAPAPAPAPAPVEDVGRYLDVFVVDQKEPFRFSGAVADAVWAALAHVAVQVK